MVLGKYECVALVLKERFGDIVEKVSVCLMKEQEPVHLFKIYREIKLPRHCLRKAMMVLIDHHMVGYRYSDYGGYIEYWLDKEEVAAILRYPLYLRWIETKSEFGEIGALVVKKLLYRGQDTATNIIKTVAANLKDKGIHSKIKGIFFKLITNNYLCRVMRTEKGEPITVRNSLSEGTELYRFPTIDMNQFNEDNKEPDTTDNVLWRLNTDMLDHYFRDHMLISAIEKSHDKTSANIIACMFKLSGDVTQWSSTSPDISKQEIIKELKNIHDECPYLNQYLTVLVDDSSKIISKKADHQGGMYQINWKDCVTELTWTLAETIVHERFGSQYLRVFRLIRLKKYIEHRQIGELAMVPAKEAKCMTYRLFAEHIVSVKEFSRTGDHSAKTAHLFYIDFPHLVTSLLDWCYKTVSNLIVRRIVECEEAKKLIEKEEFVKTVIEDLNKEELGEEQFQEKVTNTESDVFLSSEKEQLKKLKQFNKLLQFATVSLANQDLKHIFITLKENLNWENIIETLILRANTVG